MISYAAYTQQHPLKATKWEKRMDKALSVIAPQRVLQNQLARQKTHYFRYLAAYPSGSRRNSTAYSGGGDTMRTSREKQQIMWNAIETVENSGLCSSLLHRLATYIVGTLRYQARTGDKVINNEYEDYLRIKLGKAYDYTGRFTLRQSSMLKIKGILLKGDIGTNIVRDGRELYFQGIEADRIGDPYDPRISRNYIRGLHLDNSGRIISVDVFNRDRMNGLYTLDDNYQMRDGYGLPKFMFSVNPISFDDYRGVSVFKTAIDSANYIERMRNYELQAMLWASSQSGVYYTNSGLLPDKLPFDEVSENLGMTGVSSENVPGSYTARPNTIQALGVAERVEMFPHERPSPNVMAMYKDTIHDICNGAGVSYAFGYDQTGLNGPAVRSVSAQDGRAIEVWQNMLREDDLDITATLVLGNAIANGELPYHPNFNKGAWFFPPRSTIDVGRESDANINEYNAMLNDGATIAGENSQDIEEIQEQCGQETENAIEIAMDKAKKLSAKFPELTIDWREVYALMKRGGSSGQGGSSSHMMQTAEADLTRRTPDPDAAGATSEGTDMDEGGSKSKKKEYTQVVEIRHAFAYDPNQPRAKDGKWVDENGNSRDDNFKSWFGKSKVVDANGKPLRVYHGTTHDFNAFDSKQANVENDFGAGFYFTNDINDVNANYMADSPDLTNRIERLAEQLEYDDGIKASYEEALKADPELELSEYAKEQATKKMSEHQGAIYPAYLKMENPLELGGPNEPTWELGYDEETEEESGELVKVHAALMSASFGFDEVDAQKAFNDAMEKTSGFDGVKASEFIAALRESKSLAYATDENGNMASNEIIRGMLEEMGYDGVIDKTVNKKFVTDRKVGRSMVGMTHSTVHYIAFHPQNIKSAIGNSGKFDPHSNDIRFRAWRDVSGEARDKSGKWTKTGDVEPPKSDEDLQRFLTEVRKSPLYQEAESRLQTLAKNCPPTKYSPEGDVTQYTLSQNTKDGKLTPERQALHDQIIKHFLNPEAVSPEGERPKAVFLIGTPGAGKTSVGLPYLQKHGHLEKFTYVNPDDVREHLPEYEGWNAAATHAEASQIAKEEIQPEAIALRHNLLLDETGANLEKMATKIEGLGRAGYDVSVIQVTVPLHVSADRAWRRFTSNAFQRNNPDKAGTRFTPLDFVVTEVDHKTDSNFKQLTQSPYVKQWAKLDNSGPEGQPVILEEGTK